LRSFPVLTGVLRASKSTPNDEPAQSLLERGLSLLRLKIVIGSVRPGRAADRVIPWITTKAGAHRAFSVEVLDLREWALPMFAETSETVR
jgi:hypothetical protein